MAEKREYAYYAGCSLEGTAAAYDASIKLVMKSLGVELTEPHDWSCCGSTPAHAVDHHLAAALAARNLSIVEKMGASTLATPCPSCLSAFKTTQARMAKNKVFKDEVNELLDEPYNCTVDAKSALQLMYEDIGLEEMAKPATMELPDMKIAPYYGCILNRPPKIANFDDPENPVAMDKVLTAVGTNVVDFAFKLECCGAAFGVPKKETVLRLTAKVLDMAIDAGANCVAVACPLCQQNLDLRQGQVNAALGKSFSIPVLYFSQIIGLTYGYSPKELGIDKNIVSADALIRSRRPIQKAAEGNASEKGKAAAKETK
ncbi:MAG: succinate dehydrogenase/fumarate reductase iron-sulfur subunit [Syntrophorhabdaceae bacterium PtaU1.Bin034]|nr:MAG: succinate dehydrogenase/fumarate reductase iron-sulfur subunit [Syntrophorhabdaceae bacterium PtaU1.Bin034]